MKNFYNNLEQEDEADSKEEENISMNLDRAFFIKPADNISLKLG